MSEKPPEEPLEKPPKQQRYKGNDLLPDAVLEDLHGRLAKGHNWGRHFTPQNVIATALKASLLLGDSSTIRNALHEEQNRIYGTTKAIASHCPTRFGIIQMICKDLLASSEALRALFEREDWSFISNSSSNAQSVHSSLNRVDTWRQLKQLVDLMQPVSDAIHTLEGDHAYLGQILGVWMRLIEHAQEWAKANGAFGNKVVDAFKHRFNKHYHPAMAAAFILDPANFSHAGDQRVLMLGRVTEEQQLDALEVFARLSGGTTEDVQEELEGLELNDWPMQMLQMAKKLMQRREVNGKECLSSAEKRRNFFFFC